MICWDFLCRQVSLIAKYFIPVFLYKKIPTAVKPMGILLFCYFVAVFLAAVFLAASLIAIGLVIGIVMLPVRLDVPFNEVF